MLVLEHRYYGESQPFDSWKTENLRYLTVENALADIAVFIDKVHKNLTTSNPVIVIGGSYPGALAAWFRYKYPHLAKGALASSAVVRAELDMDELDRQTYDSMSLSGTECPQSIEKIVKMNDFMYYNQKKQYERKKKVMGARHLRDGDYLLFLGEAMAG